MRSLMLKDGKVRREADAPREVLTAENVKGAFSVDVMLDEHPASGNVRVTNVY